ncbi:MAG TPA: hypothetical protein ENN90_01265 [Mariniphaga anaerophila]|uniref:OmpA-like domain-containing protein n=1 Tax=Mariniphaga anaerophila TaxID=1484053 RepID=A0A831PI33_9BACT|nr:hypothetical protein [Mariniphaga anaerophila]
MVKKTEILLVLIAISFSTHLSAQRADDIENSKDHPLVSRFKGSVIEYYKETKWGSYKLPVSKSGKIDFDAPQVLEGKVTRIQYSVSADNQSEFVLQNYKAALTKSGYTIMVAIAGNDLGVSDRPHTWKDKYYEAGGYYNGLGNDKFGIGVHFPLWKNDHSFIAAKGSKGGQEIFIMVYTVVEGNYTLITQDVLEIDAVTTGMVSAEVISNGIAADGRVAIYDIYFETAKSDIKPESAQALSIIAAFIKSNPSKKYFIVGHTDNTGEVSTNLTLSQNRALSVLNELVNQYAVNKEQVKAHGVASLAPVASNATSEGKAKNRRVEIVEQ